ncbi:MAG: response regulator transcription factor [Ruminococcaceae bacterium]|nr:response regulator transcription factor [Oscillospiraceae bacterium]
MEEAKTILVADDEMRMRRIIRDYLQIKGYTVLEASDGLEALSLMERRGADLLLLDVMMPHMDGFEVCRRVRQRWTVPVIMLTARGEEEDELQGFSCGADEYISKPFSLKVLLARIEAVLRRQQRQPTGQITALDGLEVDTNGRVVRVNGQPVDLTYTEFELLTYLISNSGIALSRDRILENVWRYDYDGDARTVDTHIKKLRSKLAGQGEHIRTIRGIGYKFDPQPVEEQP